MKCKRSQNLFMHVLKIRDHGVSQLRANVFLVITLKEKALASRPHEHELFEVLH